MRWSALRQLLAAFSHLSETDLARLYNGDATVIGDRLPEIQRACAALMAAMQSAIGSSDVRVLAQEAAARSIAWLSQSGLFNALLAVYFTTPFTFSSLSRCPYSRRLEPARRSRSCSRC